LMVCVSMLQGAILSLALSCSPSCARTSLCSQCTFDSDPFLLAADNSRCLACAPGLPDAFDLDYDALDEFLRRIEAMMCVTLALSLIPHASPVTQRSLAPSITPRTPQGGRHHTVRLALAASISQACSRSRHRHILHANRRACM
jgi:hypothetical protein